MVGDLSPKEQRGLMGQRSSGDTQGRKPPEKNMGGVQGLSHSKGSESNKSLAEVDGEPGRPSCFTFAPAQIN